MSHEGSDVDRLGIYCVPTEELFGVDGAAVQNPTLSSELSFELLAKWVTIGKDFKGRIRLRRCRAAIRTKFWTKVKIADRGFSNFRTGVPRLALDFT